MDRALKVVDRMIREHVDAVKDIPANREQFGVFRTNGDRIALLKEVRDELVKEGIREFKEAANDN